MKKMLFIAVSCCFYIASIAQEEKPASDQAASSEISALQTAANLAKYGYANNSASALAEAAKIFSETQTQSLDVEVAHGKDEKVENKSNALSFDPVQLIADAKKYAGKDNVILAYINQVENDLKAGTTRGAVGGPRGQRDIVYAKDNNSYQVKFWANELAEVVVTGDGDTDLDLYIYDSNGNLISSDTDYTDDCVVRFVPIYTSTFIIKVVNRGVVYNKYAIWTN